jgi:hypothetical protein
VQLPLLLPPRSSKRMHGGNFLFGQILICASKFVVFTAFQKKT